MAILYHCFKEVSGYAVIFEQIHKNKFEFINVGLIL
jgi:hypothetical protein